jgi:hypothetical protein
MLLKTYGIGQEGLTETRAYCAQKKLTRSVTFPRTGIQDKVRLEIILNKSKFILRSDL